MKMKLKLDEKGNVVVVDGMPVYVYEDGKEVPFDAPRLMAKVYELNDENKTFREKSEAAEKKLAAFKDLDPEAAFKAISTLKNIDQKKLIDAGEVEKVKAEIGEAFKGQIGELTGNYEKKVKSLEEAAAAKDNQIFNLMVTNRFSTSKFVSDKVAIPGEFVEAKFGKQFKVEDGKVVAYDQSGKKIFSRSNPIALADFDEALEVLVESHPDKAKILKGSNATGSGKTPGTDSGGGNGFVISREKAKNPSEYQAAKAAAQKAGQPLIISKE